MLVILFRLIRCHRFHTADFEARVVFPTPKIEAVPIIILKFRLWEIYGPVK